MRWERDTDNLKVIRDATKRVVAFTDSEAISALIVRDHNSLDSVWTQEQIDAMHDEKLVERRKHGIHD